MSNDFSYAGVPGRTSGTTDAAPWEFAECGTGAVTDRPDTVYAGVEDAALSVRRTVPSAGMRCRACAARLRFAVAAGAGGMCLHTIILDPQDPDRIVVAISAAGVFRSDDGGASWQPINKACCPTGFRRRPPRSGIASTSWPGIPRGRRHCSCRSTGT